MNLNIWINPDSQPREHLTPNPVSMWRTVWRKQLADKGIVCHYPNAARKALARRLGILPAPRSHIAIERDTDRTTRKPATSAAYKSHKVKSTLRLVPTAVSEGTREVKVLPKGNYKRVYGRMLAIDKALADGTGKHSLAQTGAYRVKKGSRTLGYHDDIVTAMAWAKRTDGVLTNA